MYAIISRRAWLVIYYQIISAIYSIIEYKRSVFPNHWFTRYIVSIREMDLASHITSYIVDH